MTSRYKLSDELYIARILTGMFYFHSALDELELIEKHIHLVEILKRISEENIDQYKRKDTDLEKELYVNMPKSFGYIIDLAISALHANGGITSYDLANLLSSRLHYTKSELFLHELQREIELYFKHNQFIVRKDLDRFCVFILQGKKTDVTEV
ncbi:hypothetical protein [Enterococcus mundtii]|uniref:hypothetical protein n=1 Tax=Enterococcus mundtii TaxID=53346 RepID=UPI0013764E97|nr:hypothetical protein [Enterococcus mundtii]NBA62639.1 hypothetical protein [Enterococcus mundtii]